MSPQCLRWAVEKKRKDEQINKSASRNTIAIPDDYMKLGGEGLYLDVANK